MKTPLAQMCFFVRRLHRNSAFYAKNRRRYPTFLHTCARKTPCVTLSCG